MNRIVPAGQLGNFLQSCENIGQGVVVAQLSDEYIVERWSEEISASLEKNADKILEIRIFNEDEEHRLFRSDIGKEKFFERIIRDSEEDRDCFDEVQYLDIDTVMTGNHRKKGGMVTATGGGQYKLSVINNIHDAKIRIRYYLGRYEETGQARVEDWRMVKFIEGKGEIAG